MGNIARPKSMLAESYYMRLKRDIEILFVEVLTWKWERGVTELPAPPAAKLTI